MREEELRKSGEESEPRGEGKDPLHRRRGRLSSVATAGLRERPDELSYREYLQTSSSNPFINLSRRGGRPGEQNAVRRQKDEGDPAGKLAGRTGIAFKLRHLPKQARAELGCAGFATGRYLNLRRKRMRRLAEWRSPHR